MITHAHSTTQSYIHSYWPARGVATAWRSNDGETGNNTCIISVLLCIRKAPGNLCKLCLVCERECDQVRNMTMQAKLDGVDVM